MIRANGRREIIKTEDGILKYTVLDRSDLDDAWKAVVLGLTRVLMITAVLGTSKGAEVLFPQMLEVAANKARNEQCSCVLVSVHHGPNAEAYMNALAARGARPVEEVFQQMVAEGRISKPKPQLEVIDGQVTGRKIVKEPTAKAPRGKIAKCFILPVGYAATA